MLLVSIVYVSRRYDIIIIDNIRLSLKLFPLISLFFRVAKVSSFKVFNSVKAWFSQTLALGPSMKKLFI